MFVLRVFCFSMCPKLVIISEINILFNFNICWCCLSLVRKRSYMCMSKKQEFLYRRWIDKCKEFYVKSLLCFCIFYWLWDVYICFSIVPKLDFIWFYHFILQFSWVVLRYVFLALLLSEKSEYFSFFHWVMNNLSYWSVDACFFFILFFFFGSFLSGAHFK